MSEDEVLVEIVINGRECLQFYSTQEHFETLFQDRNQLTSTVISAFREGLLHSPGIKDVSDIQSVQFLSEVTDVRYSTGVEVAQSEELAQNEELTQVEELEGYEVIEDPTAIENLTSTPAPEELIIDVGLSTDERLNHCAYCDYRTYNVGHFKIHMRQHTGESPFECHLCDYKSKQKSNLKRHMKQHLEGKDHFECKMCNFTCTNEKIYKRHMILHSRSRPLRPCPFCDYFSTSLAHLTVHIRQHTGETPYHCGTCSYKTVQKSNLTRHLKKHRSERVSKADKLRCCSQCPYKTPNPAHLMAHIRAAHTGETPYECTHCSYRSAQRSNLKRHLRKHTGERPYKCHLCSYSTAYPYVLKKHLENHPIEPSKFTCPDCDYMCFERIDFKRHLKLHSGKTLHCCHVCGYISLNAEHLKVHMRRHTQERPYNCHYCPYTSAQKANLKRHLLYKHSGQESTSNQEEVSITRVKTEVESPTEEGDVISGDDYYNVEASESVNEHGEAMNETTVKEQAYETESAEYMNESNEYIDESNVTTEEHIEVTASETVDANENDHYEDEYDDRNPEEHVEVVSEEHIITTSMDGGEYDVIDGAYSEETCVTTSVGNRGGGLIRKRRNLSFLNKSQAEKLKEFKRLLQQGTQNSPANSSNRLQAPGEESKHNSSGGDVDNISDRTESCTEEQMHEEDVHESHLQPESEVTIVGNEKGHAEGPHIIEVQQKHSHSVEIRSSEGTEEQIQQMGDMVQQNPSILIVEDNGEDEVNQQMLQDENGEYHDVVYEYDENYIVYKCELCGHDAATVEELKVHIGQHTGENYTTTYHCDECPFKTLRKLDISRHKTLNHGAAPEKILSFVCGSCDFRAATKHEFEVHTETHKNRNLKCKVCELKLSTITEFQTHSLKHIGEEPFECFYCAYLTARKSHLRSHMRRHPIELDGKEPPHECYTCGFETHDQRVFREHTDSHKEQQSVIHKCTECRYLTLDQDDYNDHLERKHPGKYHAEVAARKDSLAKNEERIRIRKEQWENLYGRVPLKEWKSNILSSRQSYYDMKIRMKTELFRNEVLKRKMRDDYGTSRRKKKKFLKTFLNDTSSFIETHLSKKFHFDIKNLCPTKQTKSGFKLEFTGEVLKAHGSLRKFNNYGEVISKYDNEHAFIMTHNENEKQLRLVYDKLKEKMSSMTEHESNMQFTIYFRELEENPVDDYMKEPTLTDLEMSLSSEAELSDQNSIDFDSDLESLLDPSSKYDKPPKEKKIEGIKQEEKEVNDIDLDLNSTDTLRFFHEKIKERNDMMREMRKQKIMGSSSRIMKREINGINPYLDETTEDSEVTNEVTI